MIRYKVVLKKNPQTKAAKYYAQPAQVRNVSQQTVVTEIAEQSSLTTGDVKNALDRLQFVIKQHLLNGDSVKLDDLGTFSISLKTEGADSVKEFKSDNIKQVRAQFLPAKRLKDALRVGNSDVRFSMLEKNGVAESSTTA